MKYKLATTLLVVAALVVATFSAATTTPPALAAKPTTTTSPPPADSTFPVDGCPSGDPRPAPPCTDDDVILRWNEQLLATIRANPGGTGPTVASRALGVLHTATYDAWAAYSPAKATRPNGNKSEPTVALPVTLITKANYKQLFRDRFLKRSEVCVGQYKKYCK